MYKNERCTKGKEWLLVLISCLVFSCEKGIQPALSERFEIDKKYDRGPLQLSLKVSHQEITIAQRITLSLEATVPEAYEVEMPGLGENLPDFGIVSYAFPPPALLPGGRTVIQKSWKLEPFLSGVYKLPRMKIFFAPRGKEKQERHELETEEVEVSVKSLLPDKVGELKINDIAGPVGIGSRVGKRFYYGILAWTLAVASAAGIFWWLEKRREKEMISPRLPAHEIAWEEIRRLLEEELLSRGEIKLFYNRLGNILRNYVENRFGLRAPERTTEEFLHELRESDALDDSHKRILKAFLEHCDLVKFAAYNPENPEIQKTFDTCKEFICSTQEAGVKP